MIELTQSVDDPKGARPSEDSRGSIVGWVHLREDMANGQIIEHGLARLVLGVGVRLGTVLVADGQKGDSRYGFA